MRHAVIYCRVSTLEQTQNLSLETQEKACTEYSERNGLVVSRVFVEEGESAKTEDRPRLKELMSFCREKKHRIGYVVVYSVSRFARDKYVHFALRAYLTKLGITLRSVTEPIDDSATGKLLEGVLATFSQFDNDVRSDRTKAGMREAALKGQWPFPEPLGYCRIPDARGRSVLSPDPITAPLVKQAFELIGSGSYSRKQALKIVAALGLKTKHGKNLSAQSFHSMLKNPLYAGRIVCGSLDVDCAGAFKPLVPPELFQRVQSILFDKRSASATRVRNHPDFPLRHFVRCGLCEKPLTGSSSRGRAKLYPYYHCPTHSCKARNIPKHEMEDKFLAIVEQLQPKPSYITLFREIVLDVWKERHKEAAKVEAGLTSRLEELAKRKQTLIEAHLYKRVIDEDTFREQMDRLAEAVALAELERHDARLEELDIDAALNFSTHVLSNAARFWLECSHEQKQRFQRILFPEGLRFDGETFGTAPTCLAFSYLREVSQLKSSLASRTGVEPVSPP